MTIAEGLEKLTMWREEQTLRNQRDRERTEKHLAEEEREKRIILSAIAKHLGNNIKVETNGYWFHFVCRGFFVSFVNQTTRFCVTVYLQEALDQLGVLTDELRDLGRQPQMAELYREICDITGYANFIIEGSARSAIKKLLKDLKVRMAGYPNGQ